MSWTDELYNVYEQQCGVDHGDGAVLLPIFHLTANSQIEVTLDSDGNLISAAALSKKEGLNTIIPVTNDSGSRTSGVAAMPLTDKIIYLCGDYSEYTGEDNEKYFNPYITQLKKWNDSVHSHPSVRAIYTYLSKKTLMRDLIANHVLKTNEENGKLDDSQKIAGNELKNAFVRFRVLGTGDEICETWLDGSLYDSFIAFYGESEGSVGLCYATGRSLPITYNHPAKIRNTGDKAKLFSANDDKGFTYRGRFKDKGEAVAISNEFSQKMHNALRWLLQRQGVRVDSMCIAVWASALQEIPDIMDAAFDEEDDMYFAEENIPDTEPIYGKLLHRSIFGSRGDIDAGDKVMIMAVDAATTGRLSISLYEELGLSRFLQQLEKWHSEAAVLRYYPKQRKSLINSFAVRDIIKCAYGIENSKGFLEAKPEIMKENMLRLLPCITQGRAVPADIVGNLVKKASNPMAYEKRCLHPMVVEAACAMIRRENFDRRRGIRAMAYDEKITDRSYLYGCLLAIADAAERAAYDEGDKQSRVTNAKRYWSMFAKRPSVTWQVIEENLRVYMNKLGAKSIFYERELNDVMAKFESGDFCDNSPLQSSYLLGYHHYNAKIYNKKSEEE